MTRIEAWTRIGSQAESAVGASMVENLFGTDSVWLVLGQSDELGATGEAQPDPGVEKAVGDPGAAGNQTARPPSPMSSYIIWIPLILLFVFMIWSSSSTQRKEKKRREEMLGSIKRHDRVQTIGGVIGAVVEVKDDEVVLKVDETNNIKMRFARSAVQQIVAESSTGDAVT